MEVQNQHPLGEGVGLFSVCDSVGLLQFSAVRLHHPLCGRMRNPGVSDGTLGKTRMKEGMPDRLMRLAVCSPIVGRSWFRVGGGN
jgi:hypothetical protein